MAAFRVTHVAATTLATVIVLVVCTASAFAQSARLSQTDLEKLIQLKIGDDAIVAKIKSDGIAFTVDPQVLANLERSGASSAVLEAVRSQSQAGAHPGGGAPILYDDVLQLAKLGIGENAILDRLAQSPTVFTLSPQQIAELKAAGASDKLVAAMQAPRAMPGAATEMITDFAIILDCSASMREKTSDGVTKMDAAKQVVTELVQKIPEGLNVAFIVYGHEAFGNAQDPRNCEAVKVARPMSLLNSSGKSEISQLVASLRATGATPIARSLQVTGQELARNDAFCGLVLITDGLETCGGNPAAEAAALAANPKLSFGVNVVGFDVKPEERQTLAAIAEQGGGKYYNAESARDLAAEMGNLAQELSTVAQPPVVVDTTRRALRILQPSIELPAMKQIFLVEAGAADSAVYSSTASISKFGEYLNIPSSSKKYDVAWVPEKGGRVYLMRDFVLPERKVVDVKPESILGMIKVNGSGPLRGIFVMPAGEKAQGVYTPAAHVDNYGDVMVVPAGTYDLYVYPDGGDLSLIEEGLQVEAGKLYQY